MSEYVTDATQEDGGDAGRKMRLRMWVTMLRATHHIEQGLRERFKSEFGATLPRFDVMSVLIRNEGGITMSELSRFLMVSNGNVTGIIDRLVDDGLVYRYPDERDRRATLVSLTQAGRVAFMEMAFAHQDWIADYLLSMSNEDVRTMTDILKNLRDTQKAEEKTKRAGRKA